jgi:hypothetical protein
MFHPHHPEIAMASLSSAISAALKGNVGEKLTLQKIGI